MFNIFAAIYRFCERKNLESQNIWVNCDFIGDPPARYKNWIDFAGSKVKSGVVVRAKKIEMTTALMTDVETLSHGLTKGLEGEIEASIKCELMKQAEVVLSKIARKMAQNLSGSVEAVHDYADKRIEFTLVLDKLEELVPARVSHGGDFEEVSPANAVQRNEKE